MRTPRVPKPSDHYSLLIFAMKIGANVADLNAWGAENKAAIRLLSEAEQEQFTLEFKRWRWLLGTKGEGQVQ